jgi:hypothetical protein
MHQVIHSLQFALNVWFWVFPEANSLLFFITSFRKSVDLHFFGSIHQNRSTSLYRFPFYLVSRRVDFSKSEILVSQDSPDASRLYTHHEPIDS